MSIRLLMKDGSGEERSLDFSEAIVVIGRHPDNEVVLDDNRSSRRHCRVSTTDQGVMVEDLGSANGTLLNGAAVERAFLKAGDAIQIGATVLVFEPGPEFGDTVDVEAEAPATESSAAEPKASGAAASTEPAAVKSPAPTSLETDATLDESAVLPFGRLDCTDGLLKGQSFPLVGESFTLGRKSECDLRLKEARVSSKHAEIIREPDRVIVRDLGSKNGIVVNGKRCRKAVLTSGGTLAVGGFQFAVHIEGSTPITRKRRKPNVAAVAADDASELAIEQVDVEELLDSGGIPQPVFAAALVIVVGLVSYFSIDFAQRLLVRQKSDPALDGNMISANWSFEEEAEDPTAVLAWKVDQARIERTTESAQFPGRYALSLAADNPEKLARAVSLTDDGDETVVLNTARQYVCECFVANRGSFVAGAMIEWLRSDGSGSFRVIGRSFTESPQADSATIDAYQAVTAPSGATRARVSCVTFGGSGSAIFDRLSLSAVEKEASEEAETTKSSSGSQGPVLQAADGKGGLSLKFASDGTQSLRADDNSALLDKVWAGLSMKRDPMAFGPSLIPIIQRRGDAGAILIDSRIPDAKDQIWRSLEISAHSTGSNVNIEWKPPSAPGEDSAELVVYLESANANLPVLVHGRTSRSIEFGDIDEPECTELVVGRRDARASLVFATPVSVVARPHPLIDALTVLELRASNVKSPSIRMSIFPGSRSERQAALALVREATRLHQEGEVLKARGELARISKLYPDQDREIAQAKALLEKWSKEGQALVAGLTLEFSELEQSPNLVVFDSLRSRTESWLKRLGGTAEGERLSELQLRIDAFWKKRVASREAVLAEERLAIARSRLANAEYGLCELTLRSLLKTNPPEEVEREAKQLLQTLAGKREVEISKMINR